MYLLVDINIYVDDGIIVYTDILITNMRGRNGRAILAPFVWWALFRDTA